MKTQMRNPKFLIFFTLLTISFIGCATQAPVTKPAQPLMTGGIYHKVMAGETLWRISQIYNVDLDTLVEVNRIPNAAKIEKGQLIFIPGASSQKSIEVKKINISDTNFIWPIEGKIIAFFGERFNDRLNKGLEIQAKSKKDILASRSGRVSFADFLKGYGKTIIIEHPDGISTIYAQNLEIFVKPKDLVNQGMVIAKSEYLHFEIRNGAKAQNPLYYLP